MATKAAKQALQGEKVIIVNCEKAILTGNRRNIIQDFWQKTHRGEPFHGPFYPKTSDRMVRRCVRGMLPWKTTRGREAFKRVMCYVGVPAKLQAQKAESLAIANVSKLPNVKYTTVEDIAKEIGGKR